MASTQPMEQTAVSGMASIFGGVSSFSRKAQAIAGEFAKMSEENLGAGAKAAERLRDAKSLQDFMTIEADLMKESMETANTHYRKIAEIAASTPGELAGSYREFFSNVTAAGSEAAQKAGEMTRRLGENASDAVNQTADQASDMTRQGAESVRRNVR